MTIHSGRPVLLEYRSLRFGNLLTYRLLQLVMLWNVTFFWVWLFADIWIPWNFECTLLLHLLLQCLLSQGPRYQILWIIALFRTFFFFLELRTFNTTACKAVFILLAVLDVSWRLLFYLQTGRIFKSIWSRFFDISIVHIHNMEWLLSLGLFVFIIVIIMQI
jgi:hypothetical protein